MAQLSDIIDAYEASKRLGYPGGYNDFKYDLYTQPQRLPIYEFMENFFGEYKNGGIVGLFRRRAI